IPTSQSQVFTTAADNQTSVDIHVLQGERKMAGGNVTLGRFQLAGIAPAPRGIPQVEVTFDIDVNGIVNVSAKDLATGKEQKITITSSSGLSDEEIEKMVKDAEAFAEEDEKKLKEIELKNNADSMIYQADKLIKENAEQMDEDTKEQIETAKNELSEALVNDDIDEIESKTEALTSVVFTFTTQMYENANPDANFGDDIFDADYDIPEDEDEEV
ncbi:MAG: Hsp70 family protein, partial [Syntrophomonadaceae bacterium]|nr:Hsp70 family protein [Syntrophomonadaceae bacterium]